MKKPRKGQLVLVTGVDLCGELNSDSKADLAPFRAVGWVAEWTKEKAVLHSMEWDGLPSRDWGAIPVGCIKSVEVLR